MTDLETQFIFQALIQISELDSSSQSAHVPAWDILTHTARGIVLFYWKISGRGPFVLTKHYKLDFT